MQATHIHLLGMTLAFSMCVSDFEALTDDGLMRFHREYTYTHTHAQYNYCHFHYAETLLSPALRGHSLTMTHFGGAFFMDSIYV